MQKLRPQQHQRHRKRPIRKTPLSPLSAFATQAIESLEPRQLFSLITRLTTMPARPIVNINVTQETQNQTEEAAAIDPTNPQRMFVFTNEAVRVGMVGAYSTDGGASWTRKLIATGHDGLPAACCDPSAAFDQFGNLFIAYMNDDTDRVVIALSTDAGQSFTEVGGFSGEVDQPTITTGGGAVWVTYGKSDHIRAAHAQVQGLDQVGDFSTAVSVPSPDASNFGDIAIGPNGQVLIAFQSPVDRKGPTKIYTSLDPDGAGPQPFAPYRLAAKTNIGGFTSIPAQSRATIDAEVGIAFDNSNSLARGRVYMIYTTASLINPVDTSVRMMISSNNGNTWSGAAKLETDDFASSQFLPKMALDPTSGNVAVTWLDTRNDAKGSRRKADSDGKLNTDAELWGIVLRPTAGGIEATPNFRISSHSSNSRPAHNAIDFGDFQGLAFHDGVIVPAWSDNSNSTQDNPEGDARTFDVYIARVADPFA